MKSRPVLYVALLAGVVAGAAAQQGQFLPAQGQSQPSGTSIPSAPPPLPAGPAADLTIALTSQVVGYVEPCG